MDADVAALVVDDQPSYRRAAAAVVDALDAFARVDQVASGDEALAALADRRYGLVLMDVQMDGTDGLAAARLIHERFPGTPVILMSAHDRTGLSTDARRAHAAFIPKAALGPDELERVWVMLAPTAGPENAG